MKATKPIRFKTIADLLHHLGDIAPQRVRANPPPGTATEKDLIAVNDRKDGEALVELVDGVLVEKVMGFPESALACRLIKLLGNFLDQHDLGLLAGADGGMRLMPDLVRLPDVSFIRWERLPARTIPTDPIAGLAPDLAVEVLSPGNTEQEMSRKLRDYFFAGTRLVWFVDGPKRTVEVFTAPDQSVVRTEEETLDGGEVLPGFSLPLRQLFAGLSPAPPTPRRKQSKRTKK